MGIFSKKPSGPSREGAQAPDALARRAALACDSGDYAAALDAYGQAIGAIHTMCVMADPGSRTRSPGAGDQAILDGSGDSLGIVLIDVPDTESLADLVGRTVRYLHQIAAEAGGESARYRRAAQTIETTYSLA